MAQVLFDKLDNKEFYLKQGFVPTGQVLDEETVLRLTLS